MDKQRSEAWFKDRIGRVTGSNVGAILGLNPHKNADDVLREMVRAYHGAEQEFSGNIATEHGTFHEDGAAAEYEMETGRKIVECGFFPFEDWLGASPDGLIDDDGLAEIKCPYGQRDKNPPQFKTAEEQEHYWAQTQIEMFCAERQWCDFYQWAPHGTKLERIDIDPKWLEENLPKLKEFHSLYLSELDNPEHLEPKRVTIETLKADKLIQEHEELSEAIERANERKKEVLAELVAMAKERDAVICGKKLTKVEKQGSVSYSKVVKDHCPKVDLEKYRGNPSSYWRLS